MRPTLPLAKNAAKAVEATARYEGRQLSNTMVGVLSRFRGSILDAMARRMPEEDRVFLAGRWGFSSPSTSNRQSGSVEPSTPEVVEPKTSAPVSATRNPISAEEEALMKARAAGAAARKALESGATVRYSKADAKMSGHKHQDESKGESAKSSDGPQASLLSVHDESTEVATAAARTRQEKALHPILGELIADLKYKRVYRTSIASLVKAPVWEKQRILRPERAMAIAEAKLKKEFNGIPGVITLFERETARPPTADPGTSEAGSTQGNASQSGSSIEDEGPSRLGIVDGQHRVGALMLMAERGGWDSTKRNILVDVFRTSSDKDIADLFTEINRAEPVLLVDMPGDGAAEMVKEILNECTERMQEAYPEMFKASSRCRPPHVNIDNLRDEIYQSGLMTRHGVESADELYVWLTRVNAALERRGDEGWAELSMGYKGMSQEVFNKALNKARKHRFFLGMDKSWLHVV